MKNFIFIVMLSILFVLPVQAHDRTISQNLSLQYKQEIESIIDKEYPKVIKDIDNLVKEAKSYYINMKKNGFNIDDYDNLTLIAEICVPAADLNLFSELMKITQEKYLNEKYTPIGTDSTNPYWDFLYPYFKNNNVDTAKINKITIYENSKIKEIEKYIKRIEKLKK